jgi:hypothetical protein
MHVLVRSEDGVALVVVLAIMMVMSLLAAVAISASRNVAISSLGEGRNIEALGAAQAGVDVALQRLAQTANVASASFDSSCITTGESPWSNATTTPHCQAVSQSLGNGASYTYYVTASLDSSLDSSLTGHAQVRAECGTPSPPLGERCVTAIGKVAGVSRRVQVRASGAQLFQFGGLVGLKSTTVNADSQWSGGNFSFLSDTASNGSITFGQNVNPSPSGTCYLGPGATATPPCPISQPVPAPGIVAPSVDTLNFAGSKATNLNATIPAGYTAANRTLAVPASTSITLAGGNYNFCSLSLADAGALRAAAGAIVRVYIDSARRDVVQGAGSSGCSGTTPAVPVDGNVNAGTQGSTVSTILDGGTGRLEIYVYGTMAPTPAGTAPPPAGGTLTDGRSSVCGNDFDWRDASTPVNNVYIFAPNSNVQITSGAAINGAMVGCTSTFWAIGPSGKFTSPPFNQRPRGRFTTEAGTWRECKQRSFAGDPESAGCSG